ncbi:MAG: sigma-54 dependent transcriptional regulator [Saprospiraceae bacterium]|jgi:transcriptional regulator with PAS, ATPase and Fis domain|nr:sigma-54 dependent transcriptional regulator [Saprospiraceae bacterium]
MANLQSIKQRFGIIGQSEALDRALGTAIRVASTELTVLITGESGVGKENFSKIIHTLSPRKHNPFIAINCGAIPAGTINSELFGHEKGAFTGATSDRKGYFETVNGGTIFLDEIGEMPLDTQSFLLRILESGEYMRVGSSKVMTTDVRIIAATNVELMDKVKSGRFREDLYYRLSTVPIKVPALRERPEDIFMLFRKFAVDFSERYRTQSVQLDDRARLLIENYNWPGNIRELKNMVEQISVLSEDRFIKAEDLIEFIPKLLKRNLPVLAKTQKESDIPEREILFKFLFDMKNDLNDLKSLVFELIQNNNLQVSNSKSLSQFNRPSYPVPSTFPQESFQRREREPDYESDIPQPPTDDSTPIILDTNAPHFQKTEIVEESLNLEEMEKDLIKKALRKHKGRRKDAASDLGISERTLYRKIKEYEL